MACCSPSHRCRAWGDQIRNRLASVLRNHDGRGRRPPRHTPGTWQAGSAVPPFGGLCWLFGWRLNAESRANSGATGGSRMDGVADAGIRSKVWQTAVAQSAGTQIRGRMRRSRFLRIDESVISGVRCSPTGLSAPARRRSRRRRFFRRISGRACRRRRGC